MLIKKPPLVDSVGLRRGMTALTQTSTDAFPSPGDTPPREIAPPLVSVVLPVFNEVAALPRLVEQLHAVLFELGHEYELVFVDDGSTDGSGDWLDEAALERTDVTTVRLSRNFGHQAALQAGLDEARGDVVVVMDSDLQDDPRALPRFFEAWRAGHDVVYAIRTQRKEHLLKRGLFFAFYRLLQAVVDVPIPADAGNFGLLDRRVVNHLQALPERTRFFPGLRNWVGFRQIGIPVERLSRYDAVPRVSFWQLLRLAKTAVFGFSSVPIALFSALAVMASLVFGVGSVIALGLLITGAPLPGWIGTALTVSFFAALNSLGIAVLGEYIVRILDQVQGRPAYLVDHVRRADWPGKRTRDSRGRPLWRANS